MATEKYYSVMHYVSAVQYRDSKQHSVKTIIINKPDCHQGTMSEALTMYPDKRHSHENHASQIQRQFLG